MKRLFGSVVLSFAVFGAGLVAGRDTTILDEVEVADASLLACVTQFQVNVASGCGSAGWSVFAQVQHCPASVPSVVTATVYDSGGNQIDQFNLTYMGSGIWSAAGNCVNPQRAASVTFFATNGTIDDTTGIAVDANCGSC
jgi:hypothetical protein